MPTLYFRNSSILHDVIRILNENEYVILHDDYVYPADEATMVGDDWYDSDDCSYCDHCGDAFLSDDGISGIVGTYCCDNCLSEAEPPEPELDGYHSRIRRFDCADELNPWRIGLEIEKEDSSIRERILSDDLSLPSRWLCESDSSLDYDSGFEVISPARNLANYGNLCDELRSMASICNAQYSANCGGHITLSRWGSTGQQVIDELPGLWPLLLALYPHRLKNCFAVPHSKQDYAGDKYRAFSLRNPDRVEIRIFSAVRSLENLLWRLDLIKLFIDNDNQRDCDYVKKAILNPYSPLGTHLRKVYSPDALKRKQRVYAACCEFWLQDRVMPIMAESLPPHIVAQKTRIETFNVI